jgi:RNA polymerase sigma-70 factor, ECF subfamily
MSARGGRSVESVGVGRPTVVGKWFAVAAESWSGRFPTLNLSGQGGPDDASLVAEVRAGAVDRFEELIRRHQGRVFATVRRYARHETEAEDIAQDVFVKAFARLDSWRGDAPFEHWLMRMTVRTCYDALRARKRRPERLMADLSEEEIAWVDRCARSPDDTGSDAAAARALVAKILERMSPAARLVLTLLELEDKTIKEISELTGWPGAVVKVRAFRARAEMRKILRTIHPEKYL